jgi:hypothetical protein
MLFLRQTSRFCQKNISKYFVAKPLSTMRASACDTKQAAYVKLCKQLNISNFLDLPDKVLAW